jgi:hypothetical protein
MGIIYIIMWDNLGRNVNHYPTCYIESIYNGSQKCTGKKNNKNTKKIEEYIISRHEMFP